MNKENDKETPNTREHETAEPIDDLFDRKREIKPCFFCGGDAILTLVIKNVYRCTKCNSESETLFRVQE
jgi:hypothetical protein